MNAKNIILTELMAIWKKYDASEEYFFRVKGALADGEVEARDVKRGIDQLIEIVSDRDFRIREGR